MGITQNKGSYEMEIPKSGCVVYILRCRDGTLYTGWTNCMEKRLAAHNSGRGAKYTKARRPVTLAYFEPCESKRQALRREIKIKQMPRAEKLRLISGAAQGL